MKKAVLLMVILLLPMAFAKSGSMKLLAVTNGDTDPRGSTADLFLEIQPGTGRVFIDSFPLSKLDTQISTRFAKQVACNYLERDCSKYDFFYTIRSNSAIIGGPSAGAAIAVLTVSVLEDLQIPQDITMTGTINTGGIIGPVGGIEPKIEAAAKSGFDKVLIPKYSIINNSNVSKLREDYPVEIVEVTQLSEAVAQFTGRSLPAPKDVSLNQDYIDTMKEIAVSLCERAGQLSSGSEVNRSLLDRGYASLEEDEYYSAASFCFGASLRANYERLLEQDLATEIILEKIEQTKEDVEDYMRLAGKQEISTITDLETYMVVTDRLLDAEDRLDDAEEQLFQNNTNSSIYELSYAIERLNSARSWAVFFGKPGKAYDISKQKLYESCLGKIAEVEERIQYIELYLPQSTSEARDAVSKSYDDYNSGKPELCLYKSSIAKAQIDMVLNNIAVDPNRLDEVIDDRSRLVGSIIAKQNQRGIFPILGYSYYEYADSLKGTDPYSALLYQEYALELSSLDIYFEKETVSLPRFQTDLIIIYAAGLFTGFSLAIIIFALLRRGRKRRR